MQYRTQFVNLQQMMPTTQPAFTCSKLIIETLEQGVRYMFKVNNIVNFEHVNAGWEFLLSQCTH